MKCIVLAKMSRRIFAALIDFVLTLGLALAAFFAIALPLSLNTDTYSENLKTMNSLKLESRLYICPFENADPELIIDLTTNELTGINDEKAITYFNSFDYKGTKISVVDSLARFYLEPPMRDGQNIFDVQQTTLTDVANNVFKVGSEVSNIKELKLNTETNLYEISVIDNEKRAVTIEYISQCIKPDNLEYTTSVSEMVINSELYKVADEANRNMMLFAILMIIPCLFGTSLIFYFIIPICSKNGESIGKYILGLGVLSADGYVLKKYHHIPRYISLFVIELAGGILSFGGLFLVTYVMFCFSKKRRSIHDFCGNSVVIDKKASVWFVDKDQEYRYNYKTRIN